MREVIPINTRDLTRLASDMNEFRDIKSDLYTFRDAGYRLIVSGGELESFLVRKISSTLKLPIPSKNIIIGVNETCNLDVRYFREFALNKELKPDISKPPFFLTPEKVVSIDDTSYTIYPNVESLGLVGSLLIDAQVHLVPYDWMFDAGVIYRK